MACYQDERCFDIYSNKYPNLKKNIDDSISTINGHINEIVEILNNLTIPEDYLGNRVSERLQIIHNEFDNDIASLKLENQNIDTFISEKILEHKNHYIAWKKEQELLHNTTIGE